MKKEILKLSSLICLILLTSTVQANIYDHHSTIDENTTAYFSENEAVDSCLQEEADVAINKGDGFPKDLIELSTDSTLANIYENAEKVKVISKNDLNVFNYNNTVILNFLKYKEKSSFGTYLFGEMIGHRTNGDYESYFNDVEKTKSDYFMFELANIVSVESTDGFEWCIDNGYQTKNYNITDIENKEVYEIH